MIINLISSPRNVSTALMYSFAQRSDVKVVDEPFYGYYLKTIGADHPGKKEIIDSMECDFQSIISDSHSIHDTNENVFLKNMAHHLYQESPNFMHEFRNVFFIRHPKELITSFAKVIPNPTMRDIGVKQQLKLYQELKPVSTESPIVVDSSQLINNPKKLLSKLCENLEIPFDERMLSWSMGAIKEDGVWAKYWYNNVHSSTGFNRKSNEYIELPNHCKDLFNDALPYYRQLANFSIKVD